MWVPPIISATVVFVFSAPIVVEPIRIVGRGISVTVHRPRRIIVREGIVESVSAEIPWSPAVPIPERKYMTIRPAHIHKMMNKYRG